MIPEIQTIEVVKGPSDRAMQVIGNATISGPAPKADVPILQLNPLWNEVGIEGRTCNIGQGYGHGVGMSQWGARALAEQNN